MAPNAYAEAGAHHAGGGAGGLERLVLHVVGEVGRVVEDAARGEGASDVLLVGGGDGGGERRLDLLAAQIAAPRGGDERVCEVLGDEVRAELGRLGTAVPVEHAKACYGRKATCDQAKNSGLARQPERSENQLTLGQVW